MLIDGKIIADQILTKLTDTVASIKKGGIVPAMAVILVGDDPGSLSYIKQKQKAAERIGATLIFEHLPETINPETLASAIAHYNNDSSVHGLIVQRPIPSKVGEVEDVVNRVSPAKDIDGFVDHSPFEVPVARAVMEILKQAHAHLEQAQLAKHEFKSWLNTQTIAVIGRGETAGKPIADLFIKYNCAISVLHSHTAQPEAILKNSSIVVSCVGKERIITKGKIQQGAIVVAVGLWRDKNGKIHGDYDEDDIREKASFYTPTPGGVGPVNVACLMKNLVEATLLTVK